MSLQDRDEIIIQLRAEIERLREEIRFLARDRIVKDETGELRAEIERLKAEKDVFKQNWQTEAELHHYWQERAEAEALAAACAQTEDKLAEMTQALQRARHDTALWQEKWADAEAEVARLKAEKDR